ncbi:MAG: FAD-dependent oxidoreductase [Candidatus Niyogibacteria bacterium]|nr:FAD-dependent oxidoreductase [Candidatus Niyogibacteria bacterium]
MTEIIRPIFEKNTLSRKTGSWRDHELKQKPRYQWESETVSPCKIACPLENDIPYWISLLKEGKIQQAWEKLMKKNPFPAVTGRVCAAFCEESCNRKEFDESISIRDLEKFLGDEALARGWHPQKSAGKPKEFSVAIVGSGPAGLSCAYQLARKRFKVVVFEQLSVLGGQLQFGIPEFRLPKDILEKEINNLVRLGIEVKKDITVDLKLFEIIKDCYDAFFFAVGLQKSKKLDIEGENNPDVFYGFDFLKDVNLGKKISLGKKVIVIGGGNIAIDAARTAEKSGSEVVIFYRRTIAEMPAIKEDVVLAQAEGIKIKELLSPIRISNKFGRNFIECQRNRLGEPDEFGRKKPLPIGGLNFLEPFDNLIIAIGEEAEDDFFVKLKDGNKVFLGGDFKTKAGTVAAAIGSGREAAEAIDKIFSRKSPIETKNSPIVKLSDLNLAYFKHQERKSLPWAEAKRCFSCGVCRECENCFNFCPDMSVKKTNDPKKPYAVDYDYCKGCGICAKECPRGVIVMEEENESKSNDR